MPTVATGCCKNPVAFCYIKTSSWRANSIQEHVPVTLTQAKCRLYPYAVRENIYQKGCCIHAWVQFMQFTIAWCTCCELTWVAWHKQERESSKTKRAFGVNVLGHLFEFEQGSTQGSTQQWLCPDKVDLYIRIIIIQKRCSQGHQVGFDKMGRNIMSELHT